MYLVLPDFKHRPSLISPSNSQCNNNFSSLLLILLFISLVAPSLFPLPRLHRTSTSVFCSENFDSFPKIRDYLHVFRTLTNDPNILQCLSNSVGYVTKIKSAISSLYVLCIHYRSFGGDRPCRLLLIALPFLSGRHTHWSVGNNLTFPRVLALLVVATRISPSPSPRRREPRVNATPSPTIHFLSSTHLDRYKLNMAEEASKQLLADIKQYVLEQNRNSVWKLTWPRCGRTDDYSELIITCGNDTYHVHKMIVCTRSEFFAKAVRFPMVEVSVTSLSTNFVSHHIGSW
jgi:hypothetical protein